MRPRLPKKLVLSVCLFLALLVGAAWPDMIGAAEPAGAPEQLQIEVTKKGLGKEVVIKRGAKEWFMLVEVTPENTVVIRQEKENDTYVIDESETHDRAMTTGEVDTAINDFINSVKTQNKGR